MKGKARKLELNRETVRSLEADELRTAAAGQATLLTCQFGGICDLTYQPRCF